MTFQIQKILDWYASLNITKMLESKKMRWAYGRHGREKHTNFWLENLSHRDHVEKLGASGMILKCI
jgi:hypothetical protein